MSNKDSDKMKRFLDSQIFMDPCPSPLSTLTDLLSKLFGSKK